ncbi:U1 small nuclear ribonucleoprotein A (U1 snRNP A) (U1-A) (U1A) [Durusdinium trenchii]|uniref:U1 small nuclear ribonucleoprotein A (U1 snRNP A) (U1-A) (U1A) n=1 Tax=Durusdinium trenchii TaxID=1381693 RepID=A0ABP0Q7G1_9DINO
MTKTCSCQVNNLNEKIKVPELKNCLLELFSSYGEVIDIVAAGSLTKKGQAFVVFRDISCATNALRALNGFVFLDKPMKINYCRTKSDIVAHEDGTWKPRAKLEAQKEEAKRPKTTPALVPPKTVAPKMAAHPAGGDAADGQSSNVLFVENLPAEVNEVMLTMLFRQYPGFQEARLIKGRNVAFIEYADELQAGIAKHGLQGFMARRGGHTKVRNAEKLKTKCAETRNLWRRLLDTRRCIVLFDGFYEWKAHADGKTKIPMFIRNKDEYDGHVIPWVSDEAGHQEA